MVQDVGKAINPNAIEGQMQGGAVQSLGIALSEGFMYDDRGRLMNASLLDYRTLTAADVPEIETIIIEVPAPAALSNAIEHATGVRLTELPLTPERIALAVNGAAQAPALSRA